MIRIGIPRALLYYQYHPMWKSFFEELEAEVVVSPPTTQSMLAKGSARVVTDTCLPVKVFLGHVLYLVEECDRIFIPAVRSVKENVYNCSKFLGLPDMTRAVIPESPPILDIDIDINKGKRRLYQAIYQLGRHFTTNPLKIKQASQTAWQAYLDYRKLMSGSKLTPPEVLEETSETNSSPSLLASAQEDLRNLGGASPRVQNRQGRSEWHGSIALIGHPYLIYDEYINHRIIHRLEQCNYRVLTSEMVTCGELESAMAGVGNEAYWTYEEEVVGAGEYYLRNGVDGVIGLMAFGCGPDSLMMDKVHRQAARLQGAPFMPLTLEEHTAEAGVVTRLEAFTDMISRKKKRSRREVCA